MNSLVFFSQELRIGKEKIIIINQIKLQVKDWLLLELVKVNTEDGFLKDGIINVLSLAVK